MRIAQKKHPHKHTLSQNLGQNSVALKTLFNILLQAREITRTLLMFIFSRDKMAQLALRADS